MEFSLEQFCVCFIFIIPLKYEKSATEIWYKYFHHLTLIWHAFDVHSGLQVRVTGLPDDTKFICSQIIIIDLQLLI
jgi:hypothetical protein